MDKTRSQINVLRGDYIARQKAQRDPTTPVIELSPDKIDSVICGRCRVRPFEEISAYAFTRTADYVLCYCPVCMKCVWLKFI